MTSTLWLVPVAANRTGERLAVRDMTRAEANAQAATIMDSLELGLNARSPERALAGFYKGDTEWLHTQRRWVEETITRLEGHRCKLLYSHPATGLTSRLVRGTS